MAWQPKIDPRERILVMGSPGTGKTTAWMSLARKLPEATFYVLDSDYSVERFLATDYADLTNVVVYLVPEWQDWLDAIADASAKATRDDWLVFDMLPPAWDAVQEWYTEKVFGASIDDFFLEARVAQKKGSAFDGRKDWGIINKLYKSKINQTILQFHGHFFATADVKALSEDDDKAIKGVFGTYGVRPGGQKHTGHLVATILLMTKKRIGEFYMTTIKDRGRREVENAPVKDLATSYLIPIAGWRPVASPVTEEVPA